MLEIYKFLIKISEHKRGKCKHEKNNFFQKLGCKKKCLKLYSSGVALDIYNMITTLTATRTTW